ncbi:MAG TPA: LysE family translocator [Bryobacteraceae bacterium]|jgi:homoserine/homoserine lactone efflux protein|nr:LysE family translocator [Bryobacteraceae bacterium]
MTLTTWWIFVCTETVLCLMPGPAVMFVLSSALKAGARKSIASNLGILAANTVYFALSATGIGALLLSSKLFLAVKWVGAAYLVVLGLRLLFDHKESDKNVVEALNDHKSHHLFFNGFTLQMSNPKAILFFSALLPQFLNPHAAVVPQIVILGATSVVIEFSILLGYGIAGSAITPRYARWTNRVAGGLLIGAGAGLATR